MGSENLLAHREKVTAEQLNPPRHGCMFFGMDFQSAMETFAEAWVAASAGAQVSFRVIDLMKGVNPYGLADMFFICYDILIMV